MTISRFFKGISWIAVLTGIVLLYGCSPRMAPEPVEGDFEPVDAEPAEILQLISTYGTGIHSLNGRARAQVSGAGYSEQANIEFSSDRERSLLEIRNDLGIEGGRIFSDKDSVLIYDRIEKRAWKMSIDYADRALLNGYTAFNLLEFLIPDIEPSDINLIYHSETEWLLNLKDGRRIYVNKSSGNISKIVTDTENPEAFASFRFMNHSTLDGVELPRRIQILSNDGKSNIFLMIRNLKTNPENLSFDIRIPDDIIVERR